MPAEDFPLAQPPMVGPRQRILAIVVLGALANCATAPQFVPAPGKVFEGYVAIAEPRDQVPVGALWVQGYGPYGEGAAADNLTTTRSLSGVTISGDLQLTLTLGIASILHLDPAYRKRISARFSDLTIVRVKDVAKLSGPAGEPRIYEALRAGTITVTAERSLGVDLNASAQSRNMTVLGRGDTGHSQSITIDGKDLFIAFRVVTLETIKSPVESAPIKDGPSAIEAIVHGLRIRLDTEELEQCICAGATADHVRSCSRENSVAVSVFRAGGQETAVASAGMTRAQGGTVSLPLPLPVSNDPGGLFTSVSGSVDLRLSAPRPDSERQCRAKIKASGRVSMSLSGSRLRPFPHPNAPTW